MLKHLAIHGLSFPQNVLCASFFFPQNSFSKSLNRIMNRFIDILWSCFLLFMTTWIVWCTLWFVSCWFESKYFETCWIDSFVLSGLMICLDESYHYSLICNNLHLGFTDSIHTLACASCVVCLQDGCSSVLDCFFWCELLKVGLYLLVSCLLSCFWLCVFVFSFVTLF